MKKKTKSINIQILFSYFSMTFLGKQIERHQIKEDKKL